jgi:hypothetical protein
VDTTPSTADRVEIPPDAFLRLTGQLWKLALAVILPWPAVIVGYLGFRRIAEEQSFTELLVWIGVPAATLAVLVALLASVRCPQCGARLLRPVMRDSDGLGALTRLLKATACTDCAYDPRSRRNG